MSAFFEKMFKICDSGKRDFLFGGIILQCSQWVLTQSEFGLECWVERCGLHMLTNFDIFPMWVYYYYYCYFCFFFFLMEMWRVGLG